MSNRKKKATDRENDEVSELLRAAEEDIFLKLSLNSHTLRGSSSHILPPDLDQRFLSLKSQNNPPLTTPTAPNPDADDFLERFEALKKTLPTYQNHANGGSISGAACEEEGDEEDEVQKVIRWAMDAARLDPSPESDTEEEDQETDHDFDSDDEGSVKKREKGKASKKK